MILIAPNVNRKRIIDEEEDIVLWIKQGSSGGGGSSLALPTGITLTEI